MNFEIGEDGRITYPNKEGPKILPVNRTTAPLLTPTTKLSPISPTVEKEVQNPLSEVKPGSDVLLSKSSKETTEDSTAGEEFYGKSKYEGDIIDKTEPLDKEYKTNDTLPFKTSAQLLAFFDHHINSGAIKVWPWQLDISNKLCLTKADTQHPIKYCLVAANGSGKDAFVIAPFAVWFCLTKVKSRTIITSSSGTQLTAQTEAYIRNLCIKINEFFGVEYFRVRQRYVKCRLTGSEIRMFATDEAGKAEGYHPIEPGAEMCIIVNEGKSVSEEIHQALRRCTGYTHWLEASSPGEPKGFLYHAARTWKNVQYITSYDCPHLSAEDREEDKVTFGEHSSFYRSKHLALFTPLGGEVIIPGDIVEQLLSHPPQFSYPSWPKRVGIDLAAGGDESVIVITQGCKLIKEDFCRESDTTLTADWIDIKLRDNGISKEHDFIYADDGGVGRAIIDNLVRRGWNIKRILNQSPAVIKKAYGNRGAELWYNVKRIIEERFFDLSGCSRKMLDQLTNRKNKSISNSARIFLESKKEARAHGQLSPDRADAFILSLTGLTIDDFLKDAKLGDPNVSTRRRDSIGSTPQEVLENFEAKHTYNYDNLNTSGASVTIIGKRCFGSLYKATNKNYDN